MNIKYKTTSIGLLVLALYTLVLISCTKNDPTPTPIVPTTDLAAKILGAYNIIFLNQNNPVGGPQFATRSGSVVVTRQGVTLDQVTLKVSITRNTIENGVVSTITSTQDKLISLKEAGKAVDLYESSTKLGSWASDTINVRDYSFTGETINSKTIDFAAVK